MKILYITPEPPSDYSGGGIVVKQSILSLAKLNTEIDYIGPSSIDFDIQKYTSKIFYIKKNKNILFRVIDFVFSQATSSFYRDLNIIMNQLDLNAYDFIYLEFSKFSFLSKKIKDHKVVTRLHNIEYDYCKAKLKNNFSLFNLVKFIFSKNKEKKVLKYTDILIPLTKEDKKRTLSLYKKTISESNIRIIPICLEKNSTSKIEIDKNTFRFLITGSLWYGPNSEGVLWFLKNVWSDFKNYNNIELTIAGSNPNSKIKKKATNFNNVKLIESPKSMKPYFSAADFYIAPIFTGAGMKVKIGEALSHGLFLICTPHSIIGYNVQNIENGFVCSSAQEFIINIKKILENKIKQKKIKIIKRNNLSLYKNNYDISESMKKYKKILKEIKE